MDLRGKKQRAIGSESATEWGETVIKLGLRGKE